MPRTKGDMLRLIGLIGTGVGRGRIRHDAEGLLTGWGRKGAGKLQDELFVNGTNTSRLPTTHSLNMDSPHSSPNEFVFIEREQGSGQADGRYGRARHRA
jgi:hypothetical protein